jgi:P4 family phage/plasmid primase-like protien
LLPEDNENSISSGRELHSYYYEDKRLLEDPDYLDVRDNLYQQFVIELRRDGGAIRIRNTDIAVIFNPNDPAQTYQDLLNAILVGLDKEFTEDPKLWQFTKRDLRWKLKRMYKRQDKKEEQEEREEENQEEEKKEETKKETKVRELTEKLEKKYHFAAMEDTQELYYYNGKKGIYEPAEAVVKARLEKLQPGVITDTVNNVIHKLARRHLCKREEFDADRNIWNMQNGLYDIVANKLKRHTYRYLSRNQIPVRFDAKARCKRFGKFLGEVVYPEQVRTVVEMMAYTFLRDNPFELYTILIGVGANGKSVLMHVLTALHGEDNVSNTPLTLLISNRFAKKELEGKNVNIDMEMSTKASISDISVLKELTGQQPVRIEPKHLPAYTTRLWAKHFFSTNEMPEMLDFTDGHYRREVLISFPYLFEEVQTELEKNSIKAMMADSNRRIADPNLKHTLTTPEELSGIFNVLMVPLRNRITQNKPVYVDARTIEERRLRHELFSDPIGVFFREATEGDVEAKAPKELVYNAYRRFCKHYRLPVESYDHFCKLVKKKFPFEVAEGRDSGEGRKRVWKGFTLVKWNFGDSMQDILTP